MPESQAHGFTWENQVANCFGYTPEKKRYTAALDVPSEKNTVLPGVAISVKTAGGKSVDMGDICRIWKETGSDAPLHLVVVFYNQEETTKKFREVVEVNLTGARPLLFGELTEEEITSYADYVKKMTKEEAATKDYLTRGTALSARSGFLGVRPKVDSKKQKRVQCSFPNFEKFCKAHPDRVISTSTTPELRGMAIAGEIVSGRRVRHKKEEKTPKKKTPKEIPAGKVINPESGRLIKVGSPTHKKLVSKGIMKA
jgi:hypothetical protein